MNRSDAPTSVGRPVDEQVVDASTVAGWRDTLARMSPHPDLHDEMASDAERVDRIRALEELKAAAAAAQARETVALERSIRADRAARGLPAKEQQRGIGAQVALARRESPHAGDRHLGFGRALVHEMPCTRTALTTGRLSEWRATILVQETACLSREHRSEVDRRLAADPGALERLGDRALRAEARKIAYRLDPQAALRRARKAEGDRRVTMRPAPDTMVHLTALLPVKAGVTAFAALTRAADSARAEGDPRCRGQIMADTLVERLTGQSQAGTTGLEIQVVMTDRALLQGDDEPAHVPGYGAIPAGLARDWLRSAADRGGTTTTVFLRRLYTHPGTGQLVAMDARRRLFTGKLRDQLVLRDQLCRNLWCNASIRHADHVVAHARGGATSVDDGQGLCERCNYVKQAVGWRARPRPGPYPGAPPDVELTTPTGHTYTSSAPPLPGVPTGSSRSRLETFLGDLVLTA
jgi:hypothetical protein